ncbi:MAG: hypothetical protein WBA97_24285 [Actinophytocola sp.]|uniref:hypothetical protein n=1 Tax=Actinophytocola sp. TaxID=1872138 RepID=UPI003C71CE8F
MVDLGFDNVTDPGRDSVGFDAPDEELFSHTYLRLMEGFRPEPDWWRYALETVPGTLEIVMLDLPEMMVTFNDEEVARRGHDRLRAAGLRNLAKERPQAQLVDGLYVLTGSDYTASTALVLPEMIVNVSGETEFPNGVLVSMPERQLLTYHIPRDESLHIALQAMINVTLDEFDEGHKPISRHVYWWYRGEFTMVTSFDEDGTVNVHVDGPFGDVVERVLDIPVGQG